MSDGGTNPGDQRQALSALADGALDANEVQRTCAAWRDDADARATWHAYHLIGDALRADDLCAHAGADAQFLARLRQRLADEPAVLAPQPLPAAEAPITVHVANGGVRVLRRSWAAPFAVAAGFMAVAGVLVATRLAGPPGVAPSAVDTLAAAAAPATMQAQPVAASAAFASDDLRADLAADDSGADLKVVRDPALDRYLAAHRQYGYALAVPGVTLRNAAAYEPGR
jgi:sigma-E factor negative regulatory protein RseA